MNWKTTLREVSIEEWTVIFIIFVLGILLGYTISSFIFTLWFNRLKMKKINPKECKFYAQGYCCPSHTKRCGRPRNRCREIAYCGDGRSKCHVKIGSDTRCINFEPTKHNYHKKKGSR